LRWWRDQFRLHGHDAFIGQGRSRDDEVTRLKRELAQVKKERDFLREAAAFFAKLSK
jgi:transposase